MKSVYILCTFKLYQYLQSDKIKFVRPCSRILVAQEMARSETPKTYWLVQLAAHSLVVLGRFLERNGEERGGGAATHFLLLAAQHGARQ